MASKSLGTLTIDLIAKTGGFVSGMDKAERASEKWRKQVQKDVADASKTLAGMATAAAAAATAAGVAGYQLLKSTSEQVASTDKWAKSLNMSTQELLAWQFAAEKAGLSGDNMADIFKDLGDKIGDAVLNKSGEAVDALDALGLSADKLSKVSPDKQLLAIGDALGKINTNSAKINILESIGNDLSKLLPLFDNNNEKLKNFIQLAKDYGVAPDPASIDDLVKVNDLFQDMESQVKGLKIEIATGLARVDLSPLQDSLDKIRVVLTDPNIQQGLVDLVSNVAELAGWFIKTAAAAGELLKFQNNRVSILGGNIDKDNLDQVTGRIEYLQDYLSKHSGGTSIAGWITGYDDSAKSLNEELSNLILTQDKLHEKSMAGQKLPTQLATVVAGNYGLPPGGSNGKLKPDAGAKKLESAFKATELSYMRQIALIETTGKKTAEVTEAEKLRFDLASGKLVGINAEQQKRLIQLADELDKLQALKKANEENLKVAAFAANLKSSNDNDRQTLNADIVGAGMGEKTRSRMKELLGIQQDFITQQQELQKQYQSGDITKSLYDKETQALQDALKERLEIQEDYYKQSDEQRDDWSSGISDALIDFADRSSDYYQQAADAMTSVLGAATDSISDHIYDVISGTESMGDAIKGIFSDLGQSVVKALIDMAAQWLVYQGVQLLVGKTAQAAAIPAMVANAQATALQAQLAAFASTAAIPIVGPALAPAAMATAATITEPMVAAISAAGLSGMAHDGIDAVPETGTWLLQKGERVTTAGTSAKLDATLERVSRDANTGGVAPNIEIHTQVNGDPDARTLQMLKETQRAAVKEALEQSAYQIATGRGDVGKAVGMGWQTKRRTG
ncbi:phage tail tape measure protein [Serratia marcescens]|uniref:Phage tail tape measure protein n=1 Tax=Serratia marcescens TaxID=615 RepID=A0ABD5BCH6_SERMA|nr:phage tail tape measure protein [Serratia marcescens]MDQ9409459.1 phage tail tape measure protein [Serratia marcescens]MDQ9533113.1 phage tail tape measure protein [Serratia marcescens]MDQ9554080.1 phage tail tape measure protein [Serratia marcescens]MDQ9575633.1 phage tail tape measure protein [Serratia marcescens]MDQ9611486.1 phage tail tape measure protein [Serratia marcescens]